MSPNPTTANESGTGRLRGARPVTGGEVVLAGCSETQDFDEFFVSAWPWARKLAAFLTQNATVGEEIAQDALTRMYQQWGAADHPDAYLRSALYNGANNWHRHNSMRRTKLPLLAGPGHLDLGADEMADALAALPFRQRAVLVLRYYADLSEEEIAEVIGCRPGTVKSLSSRALARLATEVPK